MFVLFFGVLRSFFVCFPGPGPFVVLKRDDVVGDGKIPVIMDDALSRTVPCVDFFPKRHIWFYGIVDWKGIGCGQNIRDR